MAMSTVRIGCLGSGFIETPFFETKQLGESRSLKNGIDCGKIRWQKSVQNQKYRVNRKVTSCESLFENHKHNSSTTTGRGESSSGRSLNGSTIPSAVALQDSAFTGGSLNLIGSTDPLVINPLAHEKRILLVRHGLSIWNDEGRVQGSSNLSLLSEKGKLQALKCKQSLAKIKFDQCFSSPISRAKSSAELIWEDREEPLFFLNSLREANLLFLEGMLNEDAKRQFPELFGAWREDPANFNVDGVYPVRSLWGEARKAWEDILSAPGERILVVTHKSILRALICTALGLGPERFRAVDINNGGISVFTVNKRGEPMLEALNMTAHLHSDDVYYEL